MTLEYQEGRNGDAVRSSAVDRVAGRQLMTSMKLYPFRGESGQLDVSEPSHPGDIGWREALLLATWTFKPVGGAGVDVSHQQFVRWATRCRNWSDS